VFQGIDPRGLAGRCCHWVPLRMRAFKVAAASRRESIGVYECWRRDGRTTWPIEQSAVSHEALSTRFRGTDGLTLLQRT
jgi:hypothetical protein